ncbi:hypothetical protein OS493_020838 [Desmophyllum pertusum]|uniref:Uncharacterized protein n=1 Tax=Desmophyllum pertusum TaxID=174260 RepID=A0A9X0CFU4_9CNID|nr:hypothetical protein OS493_020838 [Desmophyllum pertusum]
MDVGFRWMEQALPGFNVYLFSVDDECQMQKASNQSKQGTRQGGDIERHFPLWELSVPYIGYLQWWLDCKIPFCSLSKELKKTKMQIQALSNRTRPIAGATGATTTDDLHSPASSAVRRSFGQDSYNLRFIQHAPEPVIPVSMRPLDGELRSRVEKAGYGLKMGGGKRVVFTLEQKEVMIEFYNRQANYGIRANPDDCIAAMRSRGLSVLKESQIKSWWSTYHQKRRRETERLAADLQILHAQVTPVTSNVTAAPAVITVPSPAVPVSSTATAGVPIAAAVAAAPAVTVSSTETAGVHVAMAAAAPAVSMVSSPAVPVSSTATAGVPIAAAAAAPAVSTITPTLPNDLMGNYLGHGITQWILPWNMSQSTMDGRNGSNACVFIALNFGLFYHQYKLDNTLLGQNLNGKWQAVLQEAMRAGNEIHDELFDGEGVNVAVDDAIVAAGDLCQVDKL